MTREPKSDTRLRGLLAVVAPLLLVGTCATSQRGGEAVLQHVVLYTGGHCGGEGSGPAVTWIRDAEQLRQVYGRLGVASLEKDVPHVDFDKRAVLLIEMGQRRTAGYGVALEDGGLRLSNDTLEVRVRWIEPEPGAITAQVLTSPCCIVELPLAGFSRIRVLDGEGRVRVEQTVR